MNKLVYLFLLLAVTSSLSCKADHPQPFQFDAAVPFGDPFIMLYDDVYYAYGTNAQDGIEVYTSDDLQGWTKSANLALDKKDSWGDQWFWAPEVYYIKEKNKFFMYYTANEHICVATADSPLGPFVQSEKKPIIESEKSIDNSLFIDADGKPYLYFVRFNDGSSVWVAELESDLKTIKESTMKKCMNVSQEWETVWPRINEGPFVIKHNNLYYLTYSANSYESPFYGVGFATSTSPLGPWTKYASNPILQKPGDLVGVGHSAIFKDKSGKLRIVFHAHHSKESIHPREMYIGEISFSDDTIPVMKVSDTIIRATIKR